MRLPVAAVVAVAAGVLGRRRRLRSLPRGKELISLGKTKPTPVVEATFTMTRGQTAAISFLLFSIWSLRWFLSGTGRVDPLLYFYHYSFFLIRWLLAGYLLVICWFHWQMDKNRSVQPRSMNGISVQITAVDQNTNQPANSVQLQSGSRAVPERNSSNRINVTKKIWQQFQSISKRHFSNILHQFQSNVTR